MPSQAAIRDGSECGTDVEADRKEHIVAAEIQVLSVFGMPELGVHGILVHIHAAFDVAQDKLCRDVPRHVDEQIRLLGDGGQRAQRKS